MSEDPWPTTGGCKAEWTQFGGGCYRLFGSHQSSIDGDIELPFNQSKEYCATEWPGATLAVFHNPYYQFFATSMMDGQRKNTWIGLLVTSTNGMAGSYFIKKFDKIYEIGRKSRNFSIKKN